MLLTAGLLIIKRGYKVYHHNQPVCFCECVTDCRHMRRPGRLFCVHMGIRRTGSLVSALWTAGQTLYCFILTCCVTRPGLCPPGDRCHDPEQHRELLELNIFLTDSGTCFLCLFQSPPSCPLCARNWKLQLRCHSGNKLCNGLQVATG